MTRIKEAKWIWMDGELVPWAEAKVHVLTHALHYGSAVFEGIRCYDTKRGPAIFRWKEHIIRLYNSAKIYRMEIPFTIDELTEAVKKLIRENDLRACYIRPLVFRGYGDMGVWPGHCPVQVVIAVWEWGAYLGKTALEEGVDVMVSSWARMAPNTFPAMAKAMANYANAQLIKMEAIANNFSEGIALNPEGYVSEGSGENIFLVMNGKLLTPSMDAVILPGITRDTVITLAKELGYEVYETHILREMLYIADEIFFTGTAAEITPVRSVDKIKIGDGKPGPITRRLQEKFFKVVNWEEEDTRGWLTPVYS